MALLKVTKDGVEVQSVDLGQVGKSAISVGRSPEADIHLEDRAVGREHAQLVISPQGFLIRKKTKFGKLLINGNELGGTDSAEAVVKPGDVISIADYQVSLEHDAASRAMPPLVPSSDGGAPLLLDPISKDDDAPDLAAIPEGETSELKLAEADAQNSQPIPPMVQSPEPSGFSFDNSASSPAEAGDRTAVFTQNKVEAKLVFKAGEANLDELVIAKPEISIGRGTQCEVVLNDKKSSRKHVVIKRVGATFILQDLGSANGTYVNDERVTERELEGGDVIRIGQTEFAFKAISQEYFEQEQGFMPVSDELSPESLAAGNPQLEEQPVILAAQQSFAPSAAPTDPGLIPGGAIPGVSSAATGSIPGIASTSKPKESLVEKFKRQPLPRKVMILVVLAAVIVFALNDEDEGKKRAPASKAVVADKADAAFKALPPEKQQYVQNTYDLALDYYKNGEYERTIYEVNKILEILPNGYKDAKDYKATANKAIEIVKAREEEKRRKEAEEKLRAEVATLVSKAQQLIDQGKDVEAKDIFAQVLERDPDNPTILRLRQQLEEKEQQRKAEEEQARERAEKRKMLEKLIADGQALLKAGRYYEAIEKMQDAPVIYAGDGKLLARARQVIVDAKNALKDKAAPFLAEAKSAMDSGNLTAARDAYLQALKIDYRNAEAKVGLGKIRSILHERAKKIFTDAVIAEGVSDYRNARQKYKECYDLSMPDDIYYGRCWRKYKRFEYIDRGTAGGAGDAQPGPGQQKDPEKPSIPNPPTSLASPPSEVIEPPPIEKASPKPGETP